MAAGVYKDELNPDNPLGMHGAIAEAFGALLHRIWDTNSTATSYSPREFKQQLQHFAPQFSGYQQHDSQELVAFLLDGLHEDLNRVLKKPYVEKPDWEGGGDKELVELAQKSWDGYMKRNDSVIVDLFQGQYQSTLVCPECQKVRLLVGASQRKLMIANLGLNNFRSFHVPHIASAHSQKMEARDFLYSLGSGKNSRQSTRLRARRVVLIS